MTPSTPPTDNWTSPLPPDAPLGGAIIDEQGREIPITEDMVQRACSELEQDAPAAD
ncbi:MAG: hypothetical protein KJ884_02125 [Gammaproteobacteria bacterium]|uniref:Uncharacterized protein n=1 Tax=Pseudomonas cuatrocienegasensis TaxID=543360 RepID=A0ABY1B2D6_9PSED|nr:MULTISPECIES: PA1571 family protein [Pseudomonas]MBU1330421.1 hypothetical protein [Gammaproteobacteria bacterium]MBU1492198.1 hypothetical protein [Gammaproteobacteria bacterium]MBU2065506.1 hypothetical protein [Gammaproteobacteria bacterium]MBU2140511.1 hypothetical protein [Gammaproteobacteria bacterium]MBU2218389.1 hypothetical protein [Gammaproteobacteria bacterium]